MSCTSSFLLPLFFMIVSLGCKSALYQLVRSGSSLCACPFSVNKQCFSNSTDHKAVNKVYHKFSIMQVLILDTKRYYFYPNTFQPRDSNPGDFFICLAKKMLKPKISYLNDVIRNYLSCVLELVVFRENAQTGI